MRWMVRLYDQTLIWSQHKKAPHYLAAVSFVESSVFPIPPYFMLAPMALARPSKAVQYALIATIASVLGGILGYWLGYLVFKPVVLPIIDFFGYHAAYEKVMSMFHTTGFWSAFIAVAIAGVTPVPYKIVAIGAGFLQTPLLAFFLASFISRGLRFFAVALLIKAGGDKMEQQVRKIIEKFGLICICLLVPVMGLLLFGCAEQQPAQVVAVRPTTYKPLPLPLHNRQPVLSQVTKKINKEAERPAWVWPAKGGVLNRFTANNSKLKGIEILGQEGSPVVAASDGEVIYSGNSLKGYGNLIIIKHKKNFLTAYAHNRKNMVKEGDRVVVGQRIAEMGKTGTDRVKLHFEVRQQGKPIDPQGVLPAKK